MKIEANEKADLNVIFNVLTQFQYHLTHFSMPLDKSRDLIEYFCERYQMDRERTHLLLSELESSNKIESFSVSEKEARKLRLKKLKSVRESMNGEAKYVALYHVLGYISNDAELTRLLSLSKQANKLLKDQVYKVCLL